MDIKLGKPQILEAQKPVEKDEGITVEFGFKLKIPTKTAEALLDKVPAIMREVPGVIQKSAPVLTDSAIKAAPHMAAAASNFFNASSPEIQQILAKGISQFGALVGTATQTVAQTVTAKAIDVAMSPLNLAASAARFGAGIVFGSKK
jgi:hypothetical protein